MLSLLKFSGPVVGLMSALWSTTQKITYEAEGGAKKLTLQGRVLIGITVLATLISLLSIGFESLIREQQAQQAAEEKAAADRLADQKEARTLAETAARDQAAALARLEADAAEQKRFLEQRFLIIGAAAAQQRRDAQISMQIAREANQRLSEAERTLSEFERINYPLRSVDAGVTVALDLDGLDLSAFWEEMAQMRDRTPYRTHRRDYVGLEPSNSLGGHILDRANRMSISLEFVPFDEAFGRPSVDARDEIRPLPSAGDFGLRDLIELPILRLESVEAHVPSRRVTAHYVTNKKLELEGVVEGGVKIALSEAAKLVPILTVQQGYVPGRRLTNRIIGASISLNGLERFSASSNLNFAGKTSFVLHMQAARR